MYIKRKLITALLDDLRKSIIFKNKEYSKFNIFCLDSYGVLPEDLKNDYENLKINYRKTFENENTKFESNC